MIIRVLCLVFIQWISVLKGSFVQRSHSVQWSNWIGPTTVAPWYQLELIPSEIGWLCADHFLRGFSWLIPHESWLKHHQIEEGSNYARYLRKIDFLQHTPQSVCEKFADSLGPGRCFRCDFKFSEIVKLLRNF